MRRYLRGDGFDRVSERERRNADLFYADLTGLRPGAAEDLPSAEDPPRPAPVGPRVQLYVDPARRWYDRTPTGWPAVSWAPHRYLPSGGGATGGPRALTQLDVLRGQHTAVTFVGAAGADIRSNNPANAVPDNVAWVDANKSSANRTIFFYGRRWPRQAPAAHIGIDHCTYFGPLAGPPIFEVCVRNYASDVVHVWLDETSSMALNADRTIKRGFGQGDAPFPYQLGSSDMLVPRDMKSDDLVDKVVATIGSKFGGTLTNLVLNAHSWIDSTTGRGYIRLGHHYRKGLLPDMKNEGFDPVNADLWDKLKGKVKYIWILGCMIGTDQAFCGDIAARTGARVTAYGQFAPSPRMPVNHIDYLHTRSPVHWDGQKRNSPGGPPSPTGDTKFAMNEDDFFLGARHKDTPELRPALAFNVVREG